MQQMSNILLSNSSQSADVSSKNNIQDIENTSFLSAFYQANESSEQSKNTSANAADTNIEVPIYDADIEKELNKTAEQLVDENADADMIFAQLTMADSIGKRHSGGGNQLPHIDKFGVYVEQSAQLEPVVDAPSVVSSSATPVTDNSFELDQINLDTIEIEGELFTNAIDLAPQLSSSKEVVAQLSEQELSDLMAFSHLSAKELQALDRDQLSAIITDFNLQAPVVDESILAMADIDFELDDTEEVSLQLLNSDEQSEIDKALGATFTGQVKENTASVSQAVTDNIDGIDFTTASKDSDIKASATASDDVDVTTANMDSTDGDDMDIILTQSTSPVTASSSSNSASVSTLGVEASASKVDLQTASTLTADPKSILGDKTRIDGNIQADPSNSKVLAKAEFSVVLDSVAAKVSANELSNTASVTTNGFDFMAETGDLETKALQNQSSFTPAHKSEVPQFQLSLRPQAQAEAGTQMQEMIQKFSPVMKQQLITMVSNGIQQAEIRLDPPELGHLTVKIQIQGDQTQVQFNVAQSQTRDLVEQAIPRLRDMLASEGLQLTDSHVSQGGDGREQQQGQSGHQGAATDSQLDEIAAQEVNLMTNSSRSLHSAIDYYA
ncbi:flagellar hook-length control protein FliK [Shewanella metallivivens]|uniref:Flagellar hook-length control protein FliK n=1 Tax=Shewanella metallivivens TaxID=2872342 RepID=A0ABT5TLN6_9GAMM|nr:flagellar hook-length control protein FliK [Shewanella metallivivens]MDD8058605.1 flagellar hook-length control protein FliK [Shewanella metallivivens]